MAIPLIGSMIWEGDYSVKNATEYRYGKLFKYFDYNWWKPEDEKIVVFSDVVIPHAVEPRFAKVPFKVAWMMEGPEVFNTFGGHVAAKNWLLKNLDKVAAVATCDDSLVEKYPDKFVFVPFGGIIVPPEESYIYPKTKLCSMTCGVMYPPRDTIYTRYKNSGFIHFLGKAFGNPFVKHVDGFKDYMYHITAPSSRAERYFSAPLCDPLACGTVPIWFGCTKLGDFFDMNGIIAVNSLDELDEALKKISIEDYNSRLGAIATNRQLVEKYRTPDNTLWENVLSNLYGKV